MSSAIARYKNYISHHGLNAVVVTGGMVVTKLLALGTAMLVARFSGVETFGEYTLFTSIFIIASTVPEQLDNTYIIRSGSADKGAAEPDCRLVNLMIKGILFLLVSLLMFLGFIIADKLFFDKLPVYILITTAVLSGMLINSFNTLVSYYRYKKQFTAVSLRRPVVNLTLFLGFVYLYFSYGEIDREGIFSVHVISAVILFLIVLAFSVPLISNYYRSALGQVRPFLAHSSVLLVSCIISLVANRLDVFFLASYISLEELGYYGVALRIAAVASMFTVVISTILLPSAPQALVNRVAYNSYLKKSVFYLIGQVAIGIILYFMANFFVQLLFSGQPSITTVLSQLLILQSLAVAIGTPFLSLIQSGKAPHFLIGVSLARMVLGVCLMLLLIPAFGIYGAAYGVTATALFVSLTMAAMCYRQYRNIP